MADNPESFDRFTAMMTALKEVLKRKEPLSAVAQEQYWDELKHVAIEQLEEAALDIRRSQDYFPTINEFILHLPLKREVEPLQIEVSPEEKAKRDERNKWWGSFAMSVIRSRKNYSKDVAEFKQCRLQYLIDNKAPEWLIEEAKL